MNDLVSAARQLLGEFPLGQDRSAGSVAAALRTAAGHVYTGIALNLDCGIGFCAEHSAIAEMLKHRETQIAEIVAVADGQTVTLRELLPHHWLVNGSKQP